MESGSYRRIPVSELILPFPSMLRERGRSCLAAYLIAREEIQTKIRQVAEEELVPGGMTRLVAGLHSLGKSRSMEDMIGDSARKICQEYSRTLPPHLNEEEEDMDIEVVEAIREATLEDEISRLIVQLLRILPDQGLLSRKTRWTSMSNTISTYIGMEEKDSDPLVTLSTYIGMELEQERSLLEEKDEESQEKQEQERSLLEEKDEESQEKQEQERSLLEEKEIEGEAVISKDKAAEIEEEAFALFRRGWEHVNGTNNFEDLTVFSPMLFTHSTPGFKPIDAVLARTVQICSIKVTDVEHFKWPLHVYGVVAARDAVDNHRNPIFLRPRDDCQIIYDVDPFLHLTGPVRAIVSEERVDIEIQLIVKGTTASEDRALISYPFLYDGDYLDGSGISIIEKNFCTVEMCYQQLESSVQATIFGVHADDGKSLPFQYGVRVACTSLSQCGNEEANESASTEVVLLDWKVGRKRVVKLGYLDLSRQVVSVELDGKLKVHIETYTSSGDIAAQGDVFVTPKECNTSEHTCDLGSFKVNFTVAWSLLVEDEEHILMNGCIDPLAFCPPIGPSTMLS